jgi:hypothetical protein
VTGGKDRDFVAVGDRMRPAREPLVHGEAHRTPLRELARPRAAAAAQASMIASTVSGRSAAISSGLALAAERLAQPREVDEAKRDERCDRRLAAWRGKMGDVPRTIRGAGI